MNKILEINTEAMYIIVQPGVRTDDLQKAVEEKNLFYAENKKMPFVHQTKGIFKSSMFFSCFQYIII